MNVFSSRTDYIHMIFIKIIHQVIAFVERINDNRVKPGNIVHQLLNFIAVQKAFYSLLVISVDYMAVIGNGHLVCVFSV